ncbi:hypothetical protein DSCA_02100 [Desulfosarcina alkanivorans]|uniref:Uncharacterized protein n=1 Tax=Desulfosarcina alkanivorans TaxID=571177 RepID=A0A5K7YE59_9BACT|nr:hypothetical protein DSCA_02100 [Desulfosarcina alkanivorans]
MIAISTPNNSPKVSMIGWIACQQDKEPLSASMRICGGAAHEGLKFFMVLFLRFVAVPWDKI